jgi:hypothetical protein
MDRLSVLMEDYQCSFFAPLWNPGRFFTIPELIDLVAAGFSLRVFPNEGPSPMNVFKRRLKPAATNKC